MGNKTRILLVEDEIITASSLKLWLEKAGYSVCPLATRGDQAIQLAMTEKPDVILMDVHLAGRLNGIETARIILESLDAKIIFLTGYHDEELVSQLNTLKPIGYVIKPVSVKQITALLETSLLNTPVNLSSKTVTR